MSEVSVSGQLVRLGKTLDADVVRRMPLDEGIELQRLLRLAHGLTVVSTSQPTTEIVERGQTLSVKRVQDMLLSDCIVLKRLLLLAHGKKKHVENECDHCVRGYECEGKRTGVVPA